MVTLCHGDCFLYPNPPRPVNGKVPSGCMDLQGVLHPTGSKWIDEYCYRCVCTRNKISCCSTIPVFTDLPSDCKSVVDKDCNYKLVKKHKPDTDCIKMSVN
ncbi:beta-microseminoprotein A1-like [Polypterus senegalus]|uniref:beta-microseminoprotein A1-like n=1 Tax=Polypterus senegalus TaxID=55291 RepID=UPI0019653820|nr:beta-microseminoprotein A1-like [Polypterus senegalus]